MWICHSVPCICVYFTIKIRFSCRRSLSKYRFGACHGLALWPWASHTDPLAWGCLWMNTERDICPAYFITFLGGFGSDKNLHLISLSQKVIHWDTKWKSPGAGLISGTAGSRALVMSPALSLSLSFVSAFHCESPLSGSITWPVGATGCPMGTRGLQNLWSRVSQLWCYWHFGWWFFVLRPRILWTTILCLEGYLAAVLVPTH